MPYGIFQIFHFYKKTLTTLTPGEHISPAPSILSNQLSFHPAICFVEYICISQNKFSGISRWEKL